MKKYLLELIDSDILDLTISRDANVSWSKVVHPDRQKEFLDKAEKQSRRLARIEKYREKVAAMALA